MKNFHGRHKGAGYFEGWYLKHQRAGQAFACIFGYHVDALGQQGAFVQIVTPEVSYHIPVSYTHLPGYTGRWRS